MSQKQRATPQVEASPPSRTTGKAASPPRATRGNAAAAEALAGTRSKPGKALRPDEQARFGAALGVDLSAVRLHDGAEGAQITEEGSAEALAAGSHIFLSPEAGSGEARDRLLLHELAHAAGAVGGGRGAPAADPGERRANKAADAADLGQAPPTGLKDPVAGAPDWSAVHREATPGDRYDDGNRPDPSTSTGTIFEVASSAARVLKVGDPVTFTLRQVQATIGPTGQQTTVSWRVINDPNAGVGPGGEMGSGWSLTLYAGAPGVHRIEAHVTQGQLSEVATFTQAVDTSTGYAELPADTVPSPLATIEDFIALVQRVEAAYPGWSWQDTTSRLRKEQYPGRGGTYGGVKAALTWDDLIDEQQSLSPLQSPPVAAADIAALRSGQVVSSPLGGIDIGHVLTGVDAMNFPTTAGLFSLHGMSGAAAATWSGDVGSALVQWATETPYSDTSDEARNAAYLSLSGPDDILGDVDAINIAALPSLPASAPLSERLSAYYLSCGEQTSDRRWHAFCQSSGFAVENGTLAPAARAFIRDQVLRFAKGYNLKGALADAFILQGGPEAYTMTSAFRIETGVDWFVDRFIADIQSGLAAEG